MTRKTQQKIVSALSDWLLEVENTSALVLDRFRKKLKLDEGAFAEALGVSLKTYRKWRKGFVVPQTPDLRDRMHEALVQYRLVMSAPSKRGVDLLRRQYFEASHLGHGVPNQRGLPGSPKPLEPASYWSHPGRYIPLDKGTVERERRYAREEFLADIRTKHAGADQACECFICSPHGKRLP